MSWTCSGVTAGMDGMMSFIAKFYGEEKAQKLSDFIEHNRVKDPEEDPFAEMNGCRDVLPVEKA